MKTEYHSIFIFTDIAVSGQSFTYTPNSADTLLFITMVFTSRSYTFCCFFRSVCNGSKKNIANYT